MEVVVDLHLHSKYSRAVSKKMDLIEMARWAGIKGIDLLGTGDFTHPLWLKELKENLEEDKGGIYKLKDKRDKKDKKDKRIVNFILTTEISSIYSQGGKTRKIHNLIIAPSFETVEKINKELTKRGFNIKSDGRPIIGCSAKDLLDLVLGVDQKCLFIPAHIWTPWFSLFGANSGFDSIAECFGNLEKYIYAVETGLSSDPEMNWRVPELENRSIVSFSDAHSGSKLGREATVLEVRKIDYERVIGVIRERGERGGDEGIKYTIEFYPEEGKYHWTGHRNCKILYSPEDSAKKGTTCPVCGKKLTVGVMERVRELGGVGSLGGEEEKNGIKWIGRRREDKKKKRDQKDKGKPPFVRLVPLAEIISEALNCGVSSQKVVNEYQKLTSSLGPELGILLRTKPEEIAKFSLGKIAEGISKVRKGDIFIKPGFDGEFGKVKVWKGKEETEDEKNENEQLIIF